MVVATATAVEDAPLLWPRLGQARGRSVVVDAALIVGASTKGNGPIEESPLGIVAMRLVRALELGMGRRTGPCR